MFKDEIKEVMWILAVLLTRWECVSTYTDIHTAVWLDFSLQLSVYALLIIAGQVV